MTNIYDLQQRADVLRKKTATDSISPEEVGGLHADTLAYIANMERYASSLGIKKVYTSVSEMNGDESPVSSTGMPLKAGQLVTIFNAEAPDAENSGEIYAFQNPGWVLVGRLDAGTADTLKKQIEGDKATVTNNNRNAFVWLGNFETWAEAQTEIDKLHATGEDNTKVGEFRLLLNGRNLIVRNFVQNWATGIFTQTVQGSIQWNVETQTMDQSLNIKTYERQYNGTQWTTWEEGTAKIELAQELSTEEGSEKKAISQKAVSEAVDFINNGESTAAEQIEIGDVTDGLYLRNDGNTVSISGRAVSDFINIEQYVGKELTLLRGGTWKDSNSYCLYDANKQFVSRSTNKSPYLKFSVNENAKYIRISCPSSGIGKVQLWHEEVDQLGLAEMSKSLTNLESDLNSVLTVEKSFWGKEEKNFISDNSGGGISPNFFIKLQGRHYTKIKVYAKGSSFSFSVYALKRDINVFVPIYTETLSFSKEEIDTVVVRSVDIEASMYDEVLFFCISGVTYKKSSYIYPGVNLYNANLSNILTKEELEDISPHLGDNYKCNLNFSLLYKDVQEENREIYLSEYFDKKDYVAYGDSISVTARNDEGEYDTAKTYPARLAKYFNFNLINKAGNGTIPIGDGYAANLTDQNLTAVTENTMLVTISGGQNKWVHDENINSTDRTTSIGAINYYIDKIREVSPTCIIVLCPTYIGNGNTQCAKDYKAISENKHVGLAPTLDLTLIDWEGDKSVMKLRYDNIHPTVFGAGRFAAVCREYIKQFLF